MDMFQFFEKGNVFDNTFSNSLVHCKAPRLIAIYKTYKHYSRQACGELMVWRYAQNIDGIV